jgi:predicted dinucleotide-binding enzyme
MTYAIIGSGAIGAAISRHFDRQGLSVLMANASGKASIAARSQYLGPHVVAAELSEALKADVIFLAVPFEAAPAIFEGADLQGRIVVDATNALDWNDFTPLDLGGRPSTDVIAEVAIGARLVKAMNHNWARVLARDPADGKGGKHVLFMSGNEKDAKAEVFALLEGFGFQVVDLGRTDEGGLLAQFGGPLTTLSLVSQAQGGASPPQMDLLNP